MQSFKEAGPQLTSVRRLGFTRRPNRDETFDSICERCLRTFATGKSNMELPEIEQAHACDHADLQKTLHQAGATYIRVQLEAILQSAKKGR